MPDSRLPVLLLVASLALLIGLWQVDFLRESALQADGAAGDDFWDAYADLGTPAAAVIHRVERLAAPPGATAGPSLPAPIPHVPIA